MKTDSSRPASMLEITESSIMDDPTRMIDVLEGFHGMGIELSVDDFGTGYSSLTYLKQLPVSEVKIDKSFVTNVTSDSERYCDCPFHHRSGSITWDWRWLPKVSRIKPPGTPCVVSDAPWRRGIT